MRGKHLATHATEIEKTETQRGGEDHTTRKRKSGWNRRSKLAGNNNKKAGSKVTDVRRITK